MCEIYGTFDYGDIVILEDICSLEEKYNKEELPKIKELLYEYSSEIGINEIIIEHMTYSTNLNYNEITEFISESYYLTNKRNVAFWKHT